MDKNLIYMVSINHDTSNIQASDYSRYAIDSWKHWCDKHGVDFLVNDTHDDRFGRPIWNKELIFEYGKEYDKIGVVDCDTMIHPDTPNIFGLYHDEFCGVVDTSDLNWVINSVSVYQKFFPDIKINIDEYYNAGVLFFHNKHLNIFEQILEFYLKNKEELDNWKLGGGKEQTILNFHLVKNGVTRKELTPAWNLINPLKKDMLKYNWQLNMDRLPYFIKYAYIWHFTGFDVAQRAKLMSQTWDIIK